MADNYWQLQRVAAAHGMTVDEWVAHCASIEAQEKSRRNLERQMRQIPKYRAAA